MKKPHSAVSLFSLSLLLSNLAQAAEINCTGRTALQKSFSRTLSISDSKKYEMGHLDTLKVSLTKKEDAHFELEIYDAILPARHYASGKLAEAGDTFSWSYWSRKNLVDVVCERNR